MKLRSRTLAPPKLRTQKFVWRGTIIREADTKEVIQWFASEFGVRVNYLGTIVTTGGRNDAVFSLHAEDVTKFAVTRFKLGGDTPSWWQDYLASEAVSEKDLQRFS